MSVERGRLLVVDDEEDVRLTLRDRLCAEGFEVAMAADGAEGMEQIRLDLPDVVLLDLQMPVMDGMEVLRRIEKERLATTVVVITAYGTIDRAVRAMQAGAFDFVTKPFEPERIRVVVAKALERARLRLENALLREEATGAIPPLIADSPAMRPVVDMARRAADSSATILLRGESGTGKEVVARHIHQWSPRRERPFVAVNCAALSPNLLESELFGHEKGAFTGALQQRQGRFEQARGGTVLLDEIGTISLDFQTKLLRILQEGTFQRVGGARELHSDARVIAATNRDLEAAVETGDFLPDLYYRLNVIAIHVPPLRKRREEIEELAHLFLRKYAREAKRRVGDISAGALAALQAYDWPGNVRELENAVERAVVLGADDALGLEDLPEPVAASLCREEEPRAEYYAALEEAKRRIIREALAECGGNQTRAATHLGLQRSYLSRLMKKLGLR